MDFVFLSSVYLVPSAKVTLRTINTKNALAERLSSSNVCFSSSVKGTICGGLGSAKSWPGINRSVMAAPDIGPGPPTVLIPPPEPPRPMLKYRIGLGPALCIFPKTVESRRSTRTRVSPGSGAESKRGQPGAKRYRPPGTESGSLFGVSFEVEPASKGTGEKVRLVIIHTAIRPSHSPPILRHVARPSATYSILTC